jgi:hypothetical protein
VLYRPDRFEYRMSLTREQAMGGGRLAARPAAQMRKRAPARKRR